jgi:translation initiation factor IF-1
MLALNRNADAMAKEDLIEMEGVVNEVLPDTRFLVGLSNGFDVIA